MDIQWMKSPNYKAGRGGRVVKAIVNHITAGDFPGCLYWLCDPKSGSSAHYLITRTGEIWQMVRESDTAWHAGIVNRPTWKLYDGANPNKRTIDIEHECISGGELTELQYQATLQLQRELCAKYGIPIDRNHIIGHYEINPVDRPGCPGKDFPWDRLMKDLQKKEVEEVSQEKRINTLEEVPAYAREFIQQLVDEGSLAGTGSGLNLTEDMIRTWVVWENHLKKAGK